VVVLRIDLDSRKDAEYLAELDWVLALGPVKQTMSLHLAFRRGSASRPSASPRAPAGMRRFGSSSFMMRGSARATANDDVIDANQREALGLYWEVAMVDCCKSILELVCASEAENDSCPDRIGSWDSPRNQRRQRRLPYLRSSRYGWRLPGYFRILKER